VEGPDPRIRSFVLIGLLKRGIAVNNVTSPWSRLTIGVSASKAVTSVIAGRPSLVNGAVSRRMTSWRLGQSKPHRPKPPWESLQARRRGLVRVPDLFCTMLTSRENCESWRELRNANANDFAFSDNCIRAVRLGSSSKSVGQFYRHVVTAIPDRKSWLSTLGRYVPIWQAHSAS
jgi:hypothetical protein